MTMRSTFRTLASLAVLGAAASIPAAGFAQTPPGGDPPAAARPHEPWAGHDHQRAEARARALHDILNIRPDQDAAFQAFIAAMRPPEGDDGMRGRHDMGEMEPMTTPQRLDRIAARMAEHQARFQRRAEAIRRFYAALSPEQQRALDALPALVGGGRHDGGMGGGPGHFGPPHPEG
jgi:Spy/CpxP family protein refolding chaperone